MSLWDRFSIEKPLNSHGSIVNWSQSCFKMCWGTFLKPVIIRLMKIVLYLCITYWCSGRDTFQNVFLFQFVWFTSNSDTGEHHDMNYVRIKNLYSNRKFKFKNIFLIDILMFFKLSFNFLDFVWFPNDRLNHNTKNHCLLERFTVWQ